MNNLKVKNKKRNLKFDIEIKKLMLAVTARRTTPNYHVRHICNTHNLPVEGAHLDECSELEMDGPVTRFNEIYASKDLYTIEEDTLKEIHSHFTKLAAAVKRKEQDGTFEIVENVRVVKPLRGSHQ